MDQIMIIGTLPPCPRCKLLTEIVTARSEAMGLDAEIRHISYTDQEAAEIADQAGLTAGTAKDVAKILGQSIEPKNMKKFSEILEPEFMKHLEPELKPLENLFREVFILDDWLRPLENQAVGVNILMTPVLIINGEIKHRGSVPDLRQIEAWLSELKKR